MGNILVGIILTVAVGVAIGSLVKKKKEGKSIGCGGDCSNCLNSTYCQPKNKSWSLIERSFVNQSFCLFRAKSTSFITCVFLYILHICLYTVYNNVMWNNKVGEEYGG